MVCESPDADIEEKRNDQEGVEEESEGGPMRDENPPGGMCEDAMRAENDVFLDKDKLAREQWDFTVSHLGSKKTRHVS
ncbi:unnamed protein product [Aureobasidium vineae]|uniref:Uncharacterized protein n=1 Tax=Aureobasidium vineae TaxID=2773715 RepID=A0A9N8JTD1_9PEZI|nr:unnamed protein product [Aureobasidium vineae]